MIAVGIAGGVDNRDVRIAPAHLFRELPAVPAGQPDVGEQQVDPVVPKQQAEGVLGAGRFEHPEAGERQLVHDHVADEEFVLDHQDHGNCRCDHYPACPSGWVAESDGPALSAAASSCGRTRGR